MDEKFRVVDENGIEKEAEVITSFTYKKKRVYTTEKRCLYDTARRCFFDRVIAEIEYFYG